MMHFRSTTIGTSLCLLAGMVAGERRLPAETPPTTPAALRTSSEQVCVAVIEPEAPVELSRVERNAIVSSVDVLLNESLAKQNGFMIVDRQSLEKAMDEKAAKMEGIAKLRPGEIAESLRPFWAAGVLVCPKIEQDRQQPGKVLVRVEAVSAQTGQRFAELWEIGDWKNGLWRKPVLSGKSLDAFWQDIRKSIANAAGRPLVEIADGRLVSELNRAQWMVDDLADAMRADVACDRQCMLLVPRQPISTKEERLLRLMGLSICKTGDAAAAIAPTPNARLTFVLEEKIVDGKPLDRMPLALTLAWSAGNAKPDTWSGQAVAGQWDSLRAKAIAWLGTRRASLSGVAPAADAESAAKAMAQQELELMRHWQHLKFSPFPDSPLEGQRCCRLVNHALRAAHLDPTSEEAAYNVALYIGAPNPQNRNDNQQSCQDRIIIECQRYLDRFGDRVKADRREEISNRLAMAAVLRCHAVSSQKGLVLALFSRQNEEAYRYASIYLPIWIDRDAADAGKPNPSNPGAGNLWACTWHLRFQVIMNCPADRLDEEYARWRKFWKERIETLMPSKPSAVKITNAEMPPWDLIEVFFQIRYQNPQKVREAYQRLADRYDESVKRIWCYNETPLLAHTLRAAHDPEWSVWRPTFGKSLPREIRQEDFGFTINLVWPPFLDSSPSGRGLPASKLIPAKEAGEEIVKGERPSQVLAVAGGQMWIASPCLDPYGRQPSRLWFARVPDERKSLDNEHRFEANSAPLEVALHAAPWPAWNGQTVQPTALCSLVSQHDGRTDFLVGTREHGIACFTRHGDDWAGRWISTREGAPADHVEGLAVCTIDGKEQWIAASHGASKERKMPNGEKYFSGDMLLWGIDPADGAIRILFRGEYEYGKLRDAWKNDRVRLMFCATHLPADIVKRLDVDKVRFEDVSAMRGQLALVGDRLWRVEDSTLTELSPQTLRPIAKPIGPKPWFYLPNTSHRGLMLCGSFFWRSSCCNATYDWPCNDLHGAVGWRDQLVMLGPGVVFYRPAPANAGDWAANDRWQFYSGPGQCDIHSFYVDPQNDLWLNTTAGLFRLTPEQLSVAAKMSPGESTQHWQQGWPNQHKDWWKRRVVQLIARRQWQQALDCIAEQERNEVHWSMSDDLKKSEHWAIPFWRARVYAEQPGMADKALAIYAGLTVNRDVPDPVRALARICQILVLHQSKQWQEVLDAYEKTTAEFPQLKTKKGMSLDTLGDVVADARDKIKTQAASQSKQSGGQP